MDDNTYRYQVVFRFTAKASLTEVDQLADQLYMESYNADPHEFQVTLENGAPVLKINGAYFHGNDFERSLLKNHCLPLILDTQYFCEGWGQKYFYKIQNGVLYDCETVQAPNENWMIFELVIEEEANV